MRARNREMVEKAVKPGGRFHFDPGLLRVLNGVAQSIVAGTPVSRVQVASLAKAEGQDLGSVKRFLAGISEPDAHGNIVGIAPGLTLTRTRHRITVDGKKLFTWCAEDALIVSAFLNRTVEIESRSPLGKEIIRLTVSPERVETVSPNDAVMSMVVVDTDDADLSSVTGIWMTFCHNIFFFPSEDEAQEWARGKDNIEIISPTEGYELARLMARAFTVRRDADLSQLTSSSSLSKKAGEARHG